MRNVPVTYEEDLKLIDPGLFAEWNDEFCRWIIKHKDDRTGLTRNVLIVQTPDLEYMDLNSKILDYLRTSIPWNLVGKYAEPSILATKILDELDEGERLRSKRDRDRLSDLNKDNIKQWERARQQLFDSMTPEQARKIKLEKEKRDYNKGLFFDISKGG